MSGSRFSQNLSEQWSRFATWLQDGLKPGLPRGIRRFGRCSPARVRQLDASLDVAQETGHVRSLLGDVVQSPVPERPEINVVILPASIQFRRIARLSERVFRRGRNAIRLQLSELSPIPPEEACFAYRDTGRRDGDIREVEIAITRATDINAVRERLVDRGDLQIAGAIDAVGRPELLFENEGRERRLLTGIITFAVIFASLYLAAWSWTLRLEADAEALRGQQASRIAALRQMREEGETFETLAQSPVTTLRTADLLYTLGHFDGEAAALATIQQVRWNSTDTIMIAGRSAADVYTEHQIEPRSETEGERDE